MKVAEPKYFVHPTACVDLPCSIGAGTKIWHFSHVMAHATIGRDCTIGQNVFIASRTQIGNNVKIQNNVSIYEGVVLGDDVFCGPSMVFTNVSTPRSDYPRNQPGSYIPTIVRRGASIGANATIVCGHEIGEFAFIGAGAVVTKDVPARAVAFGNPARVRGYACECGAILKFSGTRSHCSTCGRSWIKSGYSIVSTGVRNDTNS
jgi:UDP-2-acetamido-3-amino-2,3-dideoxy-glucuronate N-acetyltransferase